MPRICTEITKICQACGAPYHPRSDKIDVSRFCSAFCRSSGVAKELNVNQAGENNRHWKGGISKDHSHYARIQVERYPERVAARRAVREAVRSGRLVRQPCEVCGSKKVQAHHEDYSRRLDVKWLCTEHHRAAHNGMPTGTAQRSEAA